MEKVHKIAVAIIFNGKTNDNEMYLLHKYIVLIVYYMKTC